MSKLRTCIKCKKVFNRNQSVKGCCSYRCLKEFEATPTVVTNTNNVQPRQVLFSELQPRSKRIHKNRTREWRQSKRDNFYLSREWKTLRLEVIAYYGKICMACNREDKPLHVDHIIPRSKKPELSLVFSNLQVLCGLCNMGKSNKIIKDFRKTCKPHCNVTLTVPRLVELIAPYPFITKFSITYD